MLAYEAGEALPPEHLVGVLHELAQQQEFGQGE
jgi:hypothetical protein